MTYSPPVGVVRGPLNYEEIIIGLILAAVVAALTGCGVDANNYPFVKIERDTKYSHDIVIPIGRGYGFNRQVYTIEEHDDGFDIIIHVKAGERE